MCIKFEDGKWYELDCGDRMRAVGDGDDNRAGFRDEDGNTYMIDGGLLYSRLVGDSQRLSPVEDGGEVEGERVEDDRNKETVSQPTLGWRLDLVAIDFALKLQDFLPQIRNVVRKEDTDSQLVRWVGQLEDMQKAAEQIVHDDLVEQYMAKKSGPVDDDDDDDEVGAESQFLKALGVFHREVEAIMEASPELDLPEPGPGVLSEPAVSKWVRQARDFHNMVEVAFEEDPAEFAAAIAQS